MLAAPLQSTSAFNDHTDIGTQYRPAKDLQAFNALLPPPIEFVKGSSTGTTLSTGEGKYQPINAPPKVEKSSVSASSGVVGFASLKHVSLSRTQTHNVPLNHHKPARANP